MVQRAQYLRDYYARNREKLKQRSREHYHTNRERHSQRRKEHYAANREAMLAKNRAYRIKNREKIRTAELAHTGFTVVTFDAQLIEQKGCCAICNVQFDQSSKRDKACADHCHTTGQPRGLLCCACNLGLGYFKDEPARLLAAVAYLKRARVA